MAKIIFSDGKEAELSAETEENIKKALEEEVFEPRQHCCLKISVDSEKSLPIKLNFFLSAHTCINSPQAIRAIIADLQDAIDFVERNKQWQYALNVISL
jgi:hypothetical protein